MPNEKTPPTVFDRYFEIGCYVALVLAFLYVWFYEYVGIILVVVLLAAVIIAWKYFERVHQRTKGASSLAYQQAQAASKDPVPPPPNNFNWAEHALYRDSLKQPVIQPQQLYDLQVGSRLEHQLIVASTGHGKSQLMEWQILKDLNQPDPPGLIVIDSKKTMVERLARLDLFHPDHGRLRDRLVVIDPRDNPALNLFDVAVTSDEVANEVVSQLAYFLTSLLGTEVSATMGLVFRPLAQLMMHIENANLDTMVKAIDNIKGFTDSITKLDPRTQHFLLNDYPTIIGRETKTAVKRRIFAITMQSPSFEKMFNARVNRLDLADALRKKKVVLISTEANYLKDLSPVFGKFFISRAISAALAAQTQAYLYIDEAKPYTDERTEELLATLRSYKLGAILAYQTFPNLPGSLQTAIRTNTTIKFVGGGDEHASRIFAPEMRTTPEFIYNQTQDPQEPPRFTRFALFVKNKMQTAVSYQIPIANERGPTALDREPLMSEEAYRRMLVQNRAALSDTPTEPPPRRRGNVTTE